MPGAPRRAPALVIAVAVLLAGGACSGASEPARGPAPTEPTTSRPPARPRQTIVTARLSGRSVVPGPGALSGSGRAMLTFDPVTNQVCYQLTVANIDPATEAAVHTGPAGAIGPVMIALEPPAPGTSPAQGKSDGCVPIDPGLAESVVANPSGFYVSVTNIQFPGGALRGQLAI